MLNESLITVTNSMQQNRIRCLGTYRTVGASTLYSTEVCVWCCVCVTASAAKTVGPRNMNFGADVWSVCRYIM